VLEVLFHLLIRICLDDTLQIRKMKLPTENVLSITFVSGTNDLVWEQDSVYILKYVKFRIFSKGRLLQVGQIYRKQQ
jgi:hypothetical protein